MQPYPLMTHPHGQFRKTIKNYSYFLNNVIGRGYSSTVYTGVNDTNGKKVAIKVIELKFIKDLNTKKLLQTELECIKKIRHRNLLRFIDTYETANNLYIITEYCEGGDLQRELKNRVRFTQDQLAEFFAQFYSGYVSLLQAGFIHRDLKPANILIRKGRIRIADFGIVKKKDANPKDSYSVGTLVYMAPESLTSSIFTEKSDVWSIGIMCYQLLHGKLPWKSSVHDKQAIIAEVTGTNIVYDSSWMSIQCIKFLASCLDKNPNSRISTNDMLKHPWMEKVMPLMKRQQKKQETVVQSVSSNRGSLNRAHTMQQKKPVHSNSASSIEIDKRYMPIVNSERVIPLIHSSSESPHKETFLKFTYKNENINTGNNIENTGESSFQKMREKITGGSYTMWQPIEKE